MSEKNSEYDEEINDDYLKENEFRNLIASKKHCKIKLHYTNF